MIRPQTNSFHYPPPTNIARKSEDAPKIPKRGLHPSYQPSERWQKIQQSTFVTYGSKPQEANSMSATNLLSLRETQVRQPKRGDTKEWLRSMGDLNIPTFSRNPQVEQNNIVAEGRYSLDRDLQKSMRRSKEALSYFDLDPHVYSTRNYLQSGKQYEHQLTQSKEKKGILNPSTTSLAGSDTVNSDVPSQDDIYNNSPCSDYLTKSHATIEKLGSKYPDLTRTQFTRDKKVDFHLNIDIQNRRVEMCKTDRIYYEPSSDQNREITTRPRKQTNDSYHYNRNQEIRMTSSTRNLESFKNGLSNVSTRHPSVSVPTQRKFFLQEFDVKKCIGEGRFGKVYHAIHRYSGFLCALKKIPKQAIKTNKLENQLCLQIKIQSYLCHPNIVKLYGIFNDQDHLYLILEYMEEGCLYSNLKKRGRLLSEGQSASIIKEVGSAVRYMQDLSIVHRDIKPENILMSNGICKLGDFGWATVCNDRRKTNCGTLDYFAPEILQGNGYDESIDLWCLGVLTFELLTGSVPFYHNSKKETMRKIMKVEKVDFPKSTSVVARSFVEALLVKEPSQRLGINKVLLHPFITKS